MDCEGNEWTDEERGERWRSCFDGGMKREWGKRRERMTIECQLNEWH